MLGIGGVFSSSPYKDYNKWTLIPIVGYNGEYVYIRGTQAGLKYSVNDFLTVSAFFEYDSTNFDPEESGDMRMQYLDGRSGSILGGVGLDAQMSFGGKLRGSIATNIFGTHEGVVGNIAYEKNFLVHRFMITPSIGMKLYSDEYINYYYGINGDESAVSGLNAYEVTTISVEPYVGLRIGYAFTENVFAMAGGSMRFLDCAVTDSPMVDGEKNMLYTVFGGLSYRF